MLKEKHTNSMDVLYTSGREIEVDDMHHIAKSSLAEVLEVVRLELTECPSHEH